jgi:hypothetical protein
VRQSEFLDKRQYDQVGHSMRFATEIGLPLNTFATIQFGATACDPEDVGPAFRRLVRNRFTPWLRPTRAYPIDHRPAAWIYWLENVHEHDHHPHGTHVHWAIHVPPGRREVFESKLPIWVQSVAGMIFDPAVAIVVKDIDRQMGLKKYMGKAMKPADAKKRRVTPEPQGLIHGRRLSISEAINISAINAHRAAIRVASFGAGGVGTGNNQPIPWPANDDLALGQDQAPWR